MGDDIVPPVAMEGLERLTERVRNHEARIRSNHDSINQLRELASKRDKELGEFRVELREARKESSEDIAGIKKIFFWLLGFSGTASISLITLLITILSRGKG